MDRFFMFGRYSSAATRDISSERTAQVRDIVERMGGHLCEMYALLGEYDLVFIVEFPNMTDAMKTAIALGQLTGISFCTAAAVSIEQFDQMAEDLASDIESSRIDVGD